MRVTITKSFKNKEEIKDSEKLKIEYVTNQDVEPPKVDSVGECSICLDHLSDMMLPCLHAFCNECIGLWQAK